MFTIEASESYLSLGGAMLIGPGPGPGQPFFPQSAGSLTTAVSGTLRLDEVVGGIRIADSAILPAVQTDPFLPRNLPATFAGEKPIDGTHTLYFAMRKTSARVMGEMEGTPVAGAFSVENTGVQFVARDLEAEIPAIGSTGIMKLNDGNANFASTTATLSTVGNRYRLEVPVSTVFTADFSVTHPNFELTGTIVAYADAGEPLTPEIYDGGFEGNQWSGLSNGQSSAGVRTIDETGGDPELNGELVGAIAVIDGSATLRQRIATPGLWQSDTQYEVTFDIGNLADPELGLDEMATVRAYFALSGTDTTDFANHVGAYYSLASLDEIADGEWLRNQKLLLDTSGFTENQLQRSLILALQASNSGGQTTSTVLFDNVRLAVVPEPGSLLLAMLGAAALSAVSSRGKRTPACRKANPRSFRWLG